MRHSQKMRSVKRKRLLGMTFFHEVEAHEAVSRSFCRTTRVSTTAGKCCLSTLSGESFTSELIFQAGQSARPCLLSTCWPSLSRPCHSQNGRGYLVLDRLTCRVR